MGQSKGGGYQKLPTLLPEQMTLLQKLLSSAQGHTDQAAAGYAQFLPGGGGGEPIKAQAMRDYQQQTIPSILNAFGAGTKGSSSLNQALGQSGADLNTNLASMLSQLQLSASQGLGNLGTAGQQQGLGTPGFSYQQKAPPLWQQLLQGVNENGRAAVKGIAGAYGVGG